MAILAAILLSLLSLVTIDDLSCPKLRKCLVPQGRLTR